MLEFTLEPPTSGNLHSKYVASPKQTWNADNPLEEFLVFAAGNPEP